MRARIQAFVALTGAVVALVFGIACRSGTSSMSPAIKGAITGASSISTPGASLGPIGCSAIDLYNTTCEQGTTWTQVLAFTPTVIWSVGLSPQDIGNFTMRADLETPGALDNTGHATFQAAFAPTLNQDASAMLSPEGGTQTVVQASQAGSGYQNADAAAAPTVAFTQSGQTLQLVVTSPVTCVARATVTFTRSALQPWVLWVDAATLGSPVTTATPVLVGTTPGHAAGATFATFVGSAPQPCVPVSGNTSQALCTIQPGAYVLDAGQVCLTATAAPLCEQNGFTFTDAGPG